MFSIRHNKMNGIVNIIPLLYVQAKESAGYKENSNVALERWGAMVAYAARGLSSTLSLPFIQYKVRDRGRGF